MSLIISLILGVEMKRSSGWDFLGKTKIYQLVDSPLRGYDEGKWRYSEKDTFRNVPGGPGQCHSVLWFSTSTRFHRTVRFAIYNDIVYLSLSLKGMAPIGRHSSHTRPWHLRRNPLPPKTVSKICTFTVEPCEWRFERFIGNFLLHS